MQNQLPPLLGLEAFEAAARHENFAAAAGELAVSQSTISHRIRTLEAHLGHPLFVRLARGVRLTEYGKAYLPSVREAFEQVIGSTVGVFGQPAGSRLVVRAPVSYAALWLPQIIQQFHAEHPQIAITVTTSVWAERLSVDDVDIDLRLGRGEWPGLDAALVLDDPLNVVASAATAARLGAATDIDDIARCPLVHLMSGEDQWGKLLAEFGTVRPPNPDDVRVDSAVTAFGFAMSSGLVALTPRALTKPLLQQGLLKKVIEIDLPTDESLFVTTSRGDVRPRAEVMLMREWLTSQI